MQSIVFILLVSSNALLQFTDCQLQGNSTANSSTPGSDTDELNRIMLTYDKKQRPNFGGPPVEVCVQVAIVSFGPVSEKTSTFDIEIYFRQTWKDPRLRFNGTEVITMNDNPNNLLWIPDTAFPNAIESKKHYVTTINSRIKIYPTGDIFTSERVSLKCTCDLELSNFPMDDQTCGLKIESYSFTSKEIVYRWINTTSPVTVVPDHLTIEGYIMKNITTSRETIFYHTGSVSEGFTWLKMAIKISRNFSYYLFHHYCPSCLLVSMTWATFWFPSNAFPARVTLIVTTLLSCIFIVQNTISQLVRTSYRTAIEVYLTFNVLFIVSCILEYLFVINIPPKKKLPKVKVLRVVQKDLANTHENKEQLALDDVNHSASQTITFNKNEATTRSKDSSHESSNSIAGDSKEIKSLNPEAHFIDSWARIVFPLAYLTFIVTYFVYYNTRDPDAATDS